MEKSPIKFCPKWQKQIGLTLIEVLIALSIVGIALTAVIKATSQNIRSTTYLQSKTIAMWVGQQVLSEVQLGLLNLPNSPDSLKQDTEMFNQNWYWQAEQEDTPNKKIKKIAVHVFTKDPDEDDQTKAIISLESYLYHEDA